MLKQIRHIDCTLVGESPKIAKYTDKMRIKLAKTLKLKRKYINKSNYYGRVRFYRKKRRYIVLLRCYNKPRKKI